MDPFFREENIKFTVVRLLSPSEPAGEGGLLVLTFHFLKPDEFLQAGKTCTSLSHPHNFCHAIFRRSIIVSWNKVQPQLPVPLEAVSSNSLCGRSLVGCSPLPAPSPLCPHPHHAPVKGPCPVKFQDLMLTHAALRMAQRWLHMAIDSLGCA